ncbi:MAG TPA: O-antigen ligase domain-containing protein [Thiothrix sp.]|nr:O-antigen ligase domain-containing protein [Thiothrix sp.]
MHYSIRYIRYLPAILIVTMLATYPLAEIFSVYLLEKTRGIQDAQIMVETIAIITLIVFFITQPHYRFINKSQWLFILLITITPLIYLIPLPTALWELIPGREPYIQIAHWLTNGSLDDINKRLSVIPYETEHAFFALFPPLAIFLVVVSSSEKTIKLILSAALLIAIGEAMLAIIQYGKEDDYFYFGIPRLRENTSHGTYPNPDHLSTLMFVILPFSIALFIYNLRAMKHTDDEKKKSKKILLIICYSFASIFLFAASLSTSSRAGIALTFLALALTYSTFTRYTHTKTKLIIISTASIFAIVILLLTGTSSLISRFIAENPFIDGRWQIFSNTYTGISAFFPFGSGPGTFPDVYRLFQPMEQRGFINHTHNDYLELIFDTGLLGIAIITSFFFLFIKQWQKIPPARRRSFRYIQTASRISLVLFLLHAIVEFNLHDVMNVLFLGLLIGIVFHKPV